MSVDYRKQYKPEQLEPFFPNEIVKMVIVVLCTLAVLMFLVILPTLLSHAGLNGIFHEEQPADPSVTPAHIRPEWYFLAVYQYLKLMPAEIAGMDGKALGVFTQTLGIMIVLLLPFWFPLRGAKVTAKNWFRGLMIFSVMLVLSIISAVIIGLGRNQLPQAYQDLLHPMFVWPVLVAATYILTGKIGKRIGWVDAYQWLHLYSVGLILIAVQYLTFLVVLGKGLSGIMAPVLAYGLSLLLFSATLWVIIRFMIQRIRGKDKTMRLTLFRAFITEGIFLFVGLTIWAMWPAGGLYSREQGWNHETGGLLFTIGIIVAVMILFFVSLFTERQTVKRFLAPEDRDTL